MKKKGGSALRAVVLAVAIIGLVATLVSAKGKKEKEKGIYVAPTITAEQAVSTVKAALPRLTVGNSFVRTGKRGEKNLEVPLLLDANIVSRVRLNPATGEILTKGMDTFVYQVSASPEQAVKIVQQALPNVEVASASLGKEGEWSVDLTVKKAVVSHISVHGVTGSIFPDWKASQDASLYPAVSR